MGLTGARSLIAEQARRRSADAGRILGQILIGLGIGQFAFVGAAGLWTVLIG